jgi:hypothetical protein
MPQQIHLLEEVAFGVLQYLIESTERQGQLGHQSVLNRLYHGPKLPIGVVEFLKFDAADGGQIAVITQIDVQRFRSDSILDQTGAGHQPDQLGVVAIELNPVLATMVPDSNGGLDLAKLNPRVDVLHDLLHWKFELDLPLLLEPLPLLPVLQPLPEQVQLVRVYVAMVRTQRTAQVDRHDGLVRLQGLFGTGGLEFEQEETASDQVLDGLNIGGIRTLQRLLGSLDNLVNDLGNSVIGVSFLIPDGLERAQPFDQGLIVGKPLANKFIKGAPIHILMQFLFDLFLFHCRFLLLRSQLDRLEDHSTFLQRYLLHIADLLLLDLLLLLLLLYR